VSATRNAAHVRLKDRVVTVAGDGLDTRPLRLFFRGVLGAERTDEGWRCPARGRDGNDLVVRIAKRLGDDGIEVTPESDQVDLALKHEIERVRSFSRARQAGEQLLGLADYPDTTTPSAEELLGRIEEFEWNTEARELLPHQIAGLVHAMSTVNAANFSVPGSGKTATALAVIAARMAYDHVDAVVVVGPLSCFRPWEREASVALPGKLEVSRVRGMHRSHRVRVWQRVRPGQLLLASYSTAAADRYDIERLCRRLRVMLVVDESHRAKRFRGGQWAPALVQIARVARVRMILTGTPMPQGPTDLWSQFNILWPGEEATGSRLAFQARADNDFRTVIRSLEPFFTRTPKSDLGLPPARFIRHEVPLGPIQQEVYQLIENRLRYALPDAASWQDKLDALRKARPIRLLQASSNPDLLNQEDGFFRVPPLQSSSETLMQRLHRYRDLGELPAKFQWALNFLATQRDHRQKVVVWTSFIRNIDQFTKLARDELGIPVFSVDGRVPAADDSETGPPEEIDETREQRIDSFLNHDGPAVLVANPAACAESISLHSACRTAVYLDRTHDCARWLQSIDRIHRLGLPPDAEVEVHIPIATADGRQIVDDLVDASLERKTSRMQALLEGAELRGAQLAGQDQLDVAEGSDEDLSALLRYLLGEQ
jgi:SNF2 family DNA or RNA helicase